MLGDTHNYAAMATPVTSVQVTNARVRPDPWLCCADFLGMSPTRHVLLRRLKDVRKALRDADPGSVNVAEVTHPFGFTELGRFAGTYRTTFGELPSATLQCASSTRFAAS